MQRLIWAVFVLVSLFMLPLAEASEKAERFYIGIGIDIHKEIYRGNEAVIIDSIVSNGPAEKAGIRAGDVLLEVDGEEVSALKISEIIKLIKVGAEGDGVKLKIWRVILQENPTEFEVEVTRTRLDRTSSVAFGHPFTGSMSFWGGRVEFTFQVDEIKTKGLFRYSYRFKNVSKQEIYFECDILNFSMGTPIMAGRPALIYPIFFKPGETKTFVLETDDFPEFFVGASRILVRPYKVFLEKKRGEGWILPQSGLWTTEAFNGNWMGGFVPASRLMQLYFGNQDK